MLHIIDLIFVAELATSYKGLSRIKFTRYVMSIKVSMVVEFSIFIHWQCIPDGSTVQHLLGGIHQLKWRASWKSGPNRRFVV